MKLNLTYPKINLLMSILAAILMFLLAGCAGTAAPQQESPQEESSPSDAPSPAPAPAPEDQGDQDSQEGRSQQSEFVYAIEPPKISLDPIHTFTSTEAQVYTALYEGLVSYHPFNLEPMPAL
ncbi:MAG: hypothetical protein K9L66_08835, partial [Spirochaetaceae bacterium]|nr:hypothetical protein [Spirochaetaceae bacterium]MCF7951617.1 hypothetical protein [Spirochaetaceae bacterium]